ncbi:MAG: ABC transporter permease subunit [Sporolactobacillus sp.]|uniref:PhnE/PtxC family ABC transporter permease n=1 Tax=Sporolactobacillus sp. STSJ-5 TaxID=2965076 RepID=UPI002104FC29|nr:ABC transporter permease subunit [Sporolactobacillus sp. STSJ-5]MCQ2011287.1 ABC transporter permease subunit [Sporolactobacillus sp. STSJ-5]
MKASPKLTNDVFAATDRLPPIKLKKLTKSNIVIRTTMIVLAVLTVYGFVTFNNQKLNFWQNLFATFANFRTIFFQPHFNHFTFSQAFEGVLITLALGLLTTIVGAVVAFFLSLLAAENLTNKTISNSVKTLVAIIRAVPTVLWVLIFAIAAGLGSVAAVIGMSFHSISYLTKAYSESFEELDEGVIEALKATGAGWWQIVFQSIVPNSLTSLISWTFMRFEVNFGVAVAMGAAAGAGGIGYEMFMSGVFYFDIREMGTITYFILAIAIILEIISIQIKARIRA